MERGKNMIEILRFNFKRKIKEKNMTISAIERKAGLSTNAIRSFLAGRSSNPSIKTLLSACKALECPLSDLTEEHEKDKSIKTISNKILENSILLQLYENCVAASNKVIFEDKLDLSFKNYSKIINETYEFYYSKSDHNIDKDFVKWLIKKHI